MSSITATIVYHGSSHSLSLLPETTILSLQLQLQELTDIPPDLPSYPACPAAPILGQNHDNDFKELNSQLNREVAQFERAKKEGTHYLSDPGYVYEPSSELEAEAAEATVHVLGGSTSSSSSDAAEERRRRVPQAAMSRICKEEEEIEDGNNNTSNSNSNAQIQRSDPSQNHLQSSKYISKSALQLLLYSALPGASESPYRRTLITMTAPTVQLCLDLWDHQTPSTRHYLCTNQPPAPADLVAIKANIQVRQDEVQAIQAQLDDKELKPGDLCVLESRKRAEIQALERQKAILHPLRRLPPEMLREIFRHVATTQDTTSWHHLNPNSPWNLTGVCQKWRQISISFPELWSTITIGDESTNGEPTFGEPSKQLLELVLERSASSLLDITLNRRNVFLGKTWHLTDALVASSSRWRRLSTAGDYIWFLKDIRGRLDCLEEVKIHRLDMDHSEFAVTLFKVAPKLKEVEVHYADLGPESTTSIALSELQFPWATIIKYCKNMTYTAFSTSGLRLDKLPLSLCLNLIELRLDEVTTNAAGQLPLSTTLPNLKHLSARVQRSGDIAVFLNRLTLPMLKLLRLVNIQGWDAADQISLHFLVSRSLCSLTHLQFGRLDIVDPSLFTFLSLSPGIRQLILCCKQQDIVPSLHCPVVGPSGLLPHLTHFDVVLSDPKNEKLTNRIFDMLESRLASSRCARMVQVRFYTPDDDFPSAALNRIQTLKKAGLTVIIVDDVMAKCSFSHCS
ncbi:hypothetical protein C8J56DRAFT_1058472 [Mycena floridula]|nr:hypothetical protein C8J56DRAFT_1058472 [Mycena floridula]